MEIEQRKSQASKPFLKRCSARLPSVARARQLWSLAVRQQVIH